MINRWLVRGILVIVLMAAASIFLVLITHETSCHQVLYMQDQKAVCNAKRDVKAMSTWPTNVRQGKGNGDYRQIGEYTIFNLTRSAARPTCGAMVMDEHGELYGLVTFQLYLDHITRVDDQKLVYTELVAGSYSRITIFYYKTGDVITNLGTGLAVGRSRVESQNC